MDRLTAGADVPQPAAQGAFGDPCGGGDGPDRAVFAQRQLEVQYSARRKAARRWSSPASHDGVIAAASRSRPWRCCTSRHWTCNIAGGRAPVMRLRSGSRRPKGVAGDPTRRVTCDESDGGLPDADTRCKTHTGRDLIPLSLSPVYTRAVFRPKMECHAQSLRPLVSLMSVATLLLSGSQVRIQICRRRPSLISRFLGNLGRRHRRRSILGRPIGHGRRAVKLATAVCARSGCPLYLLRYYYGDAPTCVARVPSPGAPYVGLQGSSWTVGGYAPAPCIHQRPAPITSLPAVAACRPTAGTLADDAACRQQQPV